MFLQNTTGYLVGVEAETSGIVKHGSKMIQAVTNADVPKITLQIGGSFGAGHYGMCGRAFGPRFLFSWPNARVAVMGGEQAAKVMTIVAEESASARGLPFDAEKMKAQAASIVAGYDKQSTALFATARLWDDGLIDPRDSRAMLDFCLETCPESEARRFAPTPSASRGSDHGRSVAHAKTARISDLRSTIRQRRTRFGRHGRPDRRALEPSRRRRSRRADDRGRGRRL